MRVILHNAGQEPFPIEPGDRMAQLLVVPYASPELRVVDALPETERGEAGFGSSGRR